MKNTSKFSIFTLTVFLLASLCFNANAIATLPVEGMEYTAGSLTLENSPLQIWCNWINISGTQVVYYAIYTEPNYAYPVPVANLVGQHFRMEDGTQVFIASTLSELEVYRDLNGDGIPQADFASGESEILYNMYVNMSDGFSMKPVEKATQDTIAHYLWSFTYQNVHGYLQDAAIRLGVAVSVIFDHITLSYDFAVEGNVSNLKTSFDIGEVTSLEDHANSGFSLNGLSLALLYATATYTSKPFATFVDGREFNSTTAQSSAMDAEVAQVQVGGVQAYDFVFGGSYTLNRGENNETHQANLETYQAKAEAAGISSLSPTIRINPIKGMGFFRDQLNLQGLFGGTWQTFDIKYETSSLIYRICFPAWDGLQIQHDPVYIGYLLSTPSNSGSAEFPTTLALSVLAVAFFAASVLYLVVRKRRHVE